MIFLAPNTTSMFRAIPTTKTLTKIPKSSISATTQKSKTPKMSQPREKEKEKESQQQQQQQFWLLKTEPGEWSWDDQAANGGVTNWDGVRNKQAQNNLKSMRLKDLCFFYHSGAKSRRVVGVVAVTREWHGGDDGGGAVDVKAVGEMRRPVDLKEMRDDVGLKGFALLRQPRLSVVPVPADVWSRVCEMGGGFDGDGGEEELHGGGDGE